ncbi:hypothetical protein CPB86DRAFT_327336 [Serendipita vermifera]|nr:hypothetical protein CPB86DRAFT_327336 [Serendipita vermifera]
MARYSVFPVCVSGPGQKAYSNSVLTTCLSEPLRAFNRCQFVTEQGRCGRTEERLDRAQGHARQHLEYRPFVCGGKCARSDCTQRFFSSGQKDDHIRRSIPRRKQCDQCGKQISIQNVSRHMKVIHPESVTPSTGDMKPPPARGYQPY